MTVSSMAHMQTGISKAYSNYNKFLQKGSTGYKINSAADDAAGSAISSKMQAQVNASSQKALNAQDSMSMSQVKEGALSTVSDNLGKMKKLALSATGSLYGDEEKAAIQLEIDGLKGEIKDIYGKTEFNGVKVFGEDDYKDLGISDFDVTAANPDTDVLDNAISSVSIDRAGEGAKSNSLKSFIDYMSNSSYNTTAAMSRIKDTDIASLSTKLSQQKVLLQYKLMMQGNKQSTMAGLQNGILNILR